MQAKGVTPGVPLTMGSPGCAVQRFVAPTLREKNWIVTGITRDSTGAALGGCTVKLFNTATDVLSQTTTSDGSGNYSFTVDKTQSWYAVSYLTGSPDVAGTTVNTLSGQ